MKALNEKHTGIARTAAGKNMLLGILQQGVKFGLISAFCSQKTLAENMALHRQIKQEIEQLGYLPSELNAGYSFTYKGTREVYEEWYLVVPRLTFYTLITLGKKYGQYSVVFNDFDGFNLVSTDTGLVLGSFGLHAGKPRFAEAHVHEVLKHYLVSRFGQKINPAIEFLKHKRTTKHKLTTSILQPKTITKWQPYDLAI